MAIYIGKRRVAVKIKNIVDIYKILGSFLETIDTGVPVIIFSPNVVSSKLLPEMSGKILVIDKFSPFNVREQVMKFIEEVRKKYG